MLISNNLDKALHNYHLLNTLQKPTNKDKQTKRFLIQKKCVIGREVLLAYLDFNAPIETHTNASKL